MKSGAMDECALHTPLVLPGDRIVPDIHPDLPEYTVTTTEPQHWLVGPGVVVDNNGWKAVNAGLLHVKKLKTGGTIWIDCRSKRYIPVKGDNVIGIVTNKTADIFRVDIGSHETASLSFLAFEGATKKNRPDVKIGDIIYAKLMIANKHMESELVCIDSSGKANGLGVIRTGGMLINVNLSLARRLLLTDNPYMKLIGRYLPFEATIGVNGRVWVRGRSLQETVMICNLIQRGDDLTISQLQSVLDQCSIQTNENI